METILLNYLQNGGIEKKSKKKEQSRKINVNSDYEILGIASAVQLKNKNNGTISTGDRIQERKAWLGK